MQFFYYFRKEKDINDDNDLDKNFFFEDTSTEDSNKKVTSIFYILHTYFLMRNFKVEFLI